MTTIVNVNIKSDRSFENSSIVYWSFWFQGLLSTTYQVEVTFSVKGGPQEQKSIFVKVFCSLKVRWFKNIFTTNFTTITNSLSLHSKVPLTGSKAQDYKEVIDLISQKLFCGIYCVFFVGKRKKLSFAISKTFPLKLMEPFSNPCKGEHARVCDALRCLAEIANLHCWPLHR